jgi:hypothetical protein
MGSGVVPENQIIRGPESSSKLIASNLAAEAARMFAVQGIIWQNRLRPGRVEQLVGEFNGNSHERIKAQTFRYQPRPCPPNQNADKLLADRSSVIGKGLS